MTPSDNLLPAKVTDLAAGHGNFRTSIMALQDEMLALPQVECPVKHYFANGSYVREVTMPAGTLVIGKIHKYECINILLKGEITVITETGTKRMTAPCTFVSPPFTKKAAFTHSEVVWSNVVATQSLDVEEIEREAIAKDYSDDGAFLAHAQKTVQQEGLWLS